jgi:hypothetical protein
MAARNVGPKVTPEAQLRLLIERSDPKDHKLIRAVRSSLRKRLLTANELLYDYKKFFVIGYSPTENGIDSILALSAREDGLRLYLMNGPKLPDPKKLLLGSAKQTRYILVESAKHLAHPDVKALIDATIEQANVPLASKGRGTLITKTSGAKAPARKKKRAK